MKYQILKEKYIVSIYSKTIEINQEKNESYKKNIYIKKLVLFFKKGVSRSNNFLILKILKKLQFVSLC